MPNQAQVNIPAIVLTSGNNKESLLVKVEQAFNLTITVKKAYQNDKLYSKILGKLFTPHSDVKMDTSSQKIS